MIKKNDEASRKHFENDDGSYIYKHLGMFPGTAMKSLLNFSFEIFCYFFFFSLCKKDYSCLEKKMDNRQFV